MTRQGRMQYSPEWLDSLARGQHGLVLRRQLLDAGLSGDSIQRGLTSGRLILVRPRVYRLPGVPPSWHQSLLAACLWAGPNAVASHFAAGRLWKLEGLDWRRISDVLEVTVPWRQRPRAADVWVHRTRTLGPKDRTVREGIPVTHLPRTLIDLASVLDKEAMERALESAVRWRPTGIDWIRQRIRTLQARGRRGPSSLARLLGDRAPFSDRPDSDLEVVILQSLSAEGLTPPEMHYTVLDEEGVHVATLDFAYPDMRLGIQADGYRYHSGERAFRKERDRISGLTALGWRVVHIADGEIRQGSRQWIDRVRRALNPVHAPFAR